MLLDHLKIAHQRAQLAALLPSRFEILGIECHRPRLIGDPPALEGDLHGDHHIIEDRARREFGE